MNPFNYSHVFQIITQFMKDSNSMGVASRHKIQKCVFAFALLIPSVAYYAMSYRVPDMNTKLSVFSTAEHTVELNYLHYVFDYNGHQENFFDPEAPQGYPQSSPGIYYSFHFPDSLNGQNDTRHGNLVDVDGHISYGNGEHNDKFLPLAEPLQTLSAEEKSAISEALCFRITTPPDDHFRPIWLGIVHTTPRFNPCGTWFQDHGKYSTAYMKGRIPSADLYLYGQRNFATIKRPVVNNVSMSSFKPNILWAHDVSQTNHRLSFETDSNAVLKLNRLVFDFRGAVDFSNIAPAPDSIGMSYIQYTDSTKLSQIVTNGLNFATKNPDMQNKMLMKMFVLTAWITFLLGVIGKEIYYFVAKLLRRFSVRHPKVYKISFCLVCTLLILYTFLTLL